MKRTSFLKKNYIEVIIILFSLTFSFWLMFSTFSYSNGSMLISTKAWSDFASHIPLIRSFSLGANFPVEYPIFPGEPVRYHFLFYLFAGLLEKTGLRIDWSLNLLSAFSFSFLMIIIYFFAKNLFKSEFVGFLSVIFFIFNGSLSFIEFFKIHPLSLKSLSDIAANNIFPSFGPYDGKIVSAFWNLNIYTNQRHLALSFALLFFIVCLIIENGQKNKRLPFVLIILFGILVGIFPFLHSAVFIMSLLILGVLFLLLKKIRRDIFFIILTGVILSLPRIIFLKQTASFLPHFQTGYIIANNLSFLNFIHYWFMNLGLSLFLIPLGFFLASGFAKKIFTAFFPLFIIGNVFQFSPEIAGNHKFFNAFLILGNMYSAYALYRLWKTNLMRPFVILLIFLLTFSGFIDFFPIKNDSYIGLEDYPKNPQVKWIVENTPKNSVFLNSSYLYNPPSIAGRKIFLGWPYFSWSLGYDMDKRGKLIEKMWQEENKNLACALLTENSINYLEINKDSKDYKISLLYEKTFSLGYSNQRNSYFIYDVKKSCENN